MKLKQQKQIKAFLNQAFGTDKGGALFARFSRSKSKGPGPLRLKQAGAFAYLAVLSG